MGRCAFRKSQKSVQNCANQHRTLCAINKFFRLIFGVFYGSKIKNIMSFAIFPVHLSKLLRLPRKKSDARSYDMLHLLRKSAPAPPNSSDEHVSCTVHATENASFQIFIKCPTPAIVFWNATNPSRFAHFWQGPQSLAPATRNNIWTSKNGPNPWCFQHLGLEMCFAPQRRALFRQRNFEKWSEAEVFCTFWLRNVLRATTACAF